MNKRSKIILAVVFSVLILVTAGSILLLMGNREVIDEEQVVSKLYWNIDGSKMFNSQSGLTQRQKEADGLYRVRFAVEGEHVEFRVADGRLMNRIDQQTLMGLKVDENNVITEMLDVRDITAGEVASYCYVMSVEDKKIVTNSMIDGDGITVEIPLTKNTKVYNVSSSAKVIGEEGMPAKEDRIRAFKDETGEITDVFVIGKYRIFDGEVSEGYCEHCKKEVTWFEWTNITGLPKTSGHYRMMTDVQLMDTQVSLPENCNIVIDLNGKTLKNAYGRRLYAMFNEGIYLGIVDQSKEQSGRMVVEGEYNGNGMLIWARYGTFELYSGTLDASKGISSGSGVAVGLNPTSTFNMYGGTIIGGTAKSAANLDGTFATAYAGSVMVTKDSVFNMYGGTIRDGKAVLYTKEKGGTIGGRGGNIYIGGGGVMNLYGGEILGGVADHVGGNVMLGNIDAVFNMKGGTISDGSVSRLNCNSGNVHIFQGATMNMEGGTIKNGMSTGLGGNVTVYGTLNMSGGVIKDGKVMTGDSMKTLKQVENYTANIHSSNGTLNMSGGVINGYVRMSSAGKNEDGTPNRATVKISGTARIEGGSMNLTLAGGTVIDFGTLKKGANICLASSGYISSNTIAANAAYVHHDHEAVETLYINEKLFLGAYHCVCGGVHKNEDGQITEGHIGSCNGTPIEWNPWTESADLPISTGNYYLVTDVTTTKLRGAQKDAIIKLDLNGHKITGAKDQRVYAENGANIDFTLTDSSKAQTGCLVASGNTEYAGMCIWITGKGSKLTMYGGTLDASQSQSTGDGVAINLGRYCEFDMYGGTIIGGDAKQNKKTNGGGVGGAVSVAGQMSMYGGIIQDGTAEVNGGNLYIKDTGSLKMHGGTILNGKASKKGGNIQTYGELSVYNKATVKKGDAGTYGGNICVGQSITKDEKDIVTSYKYGTMNMHGGSVESGHAIKSGGNIYIEGCYQMYGGRVVYGTADELQNSGNIYGLQGQKEDIFYMSGGTINGNVTFNAVVNVTLTERPVIKGAETNLVIPKNQKITVEALSSGADVHVSGVGIIATTSVKENEKYFTLDVGSRYEGEDIQVCYFDSKLAIGRRPSVGSCLCGHSQVDGDDSQCIGECDGIWRVWQPTDELPKTSGNWYLTKDISDAKQANIAQNHTVCLDLNGKSVTMARNEDSAVGNYFRAFVLANENVTLMITDLSSTKTGKIVSGKKGDNGQLLRVMNESANVYLYGGTLDGTNSTDSDAHGALSPVVSLESGKIYMFDGNILCLQKNNIAGNGNIYIGSEFNMFGGTIIGGVAKNGGNIYVGVNGVFTMENGKQNTSPSVLGGTATFGGNVFVGENGHFVMKGGIVSGGNATTDGGNVDVKNGGRFDMSGGSLGEEIVIRAVTYKGGNSVYGGNVYVNGTDANMKGMMTISGDASIANGTALTSGGNIYVGGKGHAQVTGGSISNGVATIEADAGNVGVGGVFEITGGTINGLVYLKENNVMTVGGSAKIQSDSATGKGLSMKSGKFISISSETPFVAGAQIAINGYGKVASGTPEECLSAKYIILDNSSHKKAILTRDADGTARITVKSCVCGKELYGADNICTSCGSAKLAWEPYYTTNNLSLTVGRNYYLVSDITMSNSPVLSAGTVNLDLNGKTVKNAVNPDSTTGNCLRIYTVKGTGILNITDTSGNAGIMKSVCKGDSGQVIWANGGTIHLWNGVLDGTEATSNTSPAVAPVVAVQNGGKFYMHGGTIKGALDNKVTVGNIFVGGTQETKSVFEMTGGQIIGGKAVNGGSVYIGAYGEFTMTNGSITGGEAQNGGNVFIESSGIFNMNGGIISGGNATAYGGNVYVQGSLTLSGDKAEIVEGEAATQGGNVFVAGVGSANMTKGKIYGGKAKNPVSSGNVGLSGLLTMSGGEIQGLVYVGAHDKLKLSGTARIVSESSSGVGLTLGAVSGALKCRQIRMIGAFSAGAQIDINATSALGQITYGYNPNTISNILLYVQMDMASRQNYQIIEEDHTTAGQKRLSITTKGN